MTELFLKIVNMSISATWLILVVIILKLLLKKAPKWLSTVLWCIVGIRLLLPFPAESTLSMIPSTETISPQIMYNQNPTIHSGIEALNSTINPIISESLAPDPSASANPLQIWIPIASMIWIAGSLILLAYASFSYIRLKKRLCTAVLLQENVYQSENVVSPFVLGIIRPRIYLPFHISEANIAMVIAHERAHIKHHHHQMKFIAFLLLSIHWFNPILWAAYVLLCRDIELACDEYVVQSLDEKERADYSETLLALSIPRRMITACPLAFGAGSVKKRVKNVLGYKKPAFFIVVMAASVCFIVAVCFLTNPRENAAQEDLSPNLNDIFSNNSSSKRMTLDDVFLLAQKDENPTWEDLDDFKHTTFGSGFVRDAFIIDSMFYLEVGPGVGYFHLCHLNPDRTNDPFTWRDEYIDIKNCDTETIENFIRKYQEDNSSNNNIPYLSHCCIVEDTDGNAFDKMLELSENKDSSTKLSGSIMNLPVVKIGCRAELDSFCDGMDDYFEFTKLQSETPSFAETIEKYDEEFFKANSIFIIYACTDSSSSPPYPEIMYLRKYSDTLSVSVMCSQSREPNGGCLIPLDLNTSWLMIIEASNADVSNITQAAAYLSPVYE